MIGLNGGNSDMAIYDWNRDGCLSKLFIGGIIIIIYLFGSVYEPEKPCMAIGCMENRIGNSIYCVEHS